MAVSEMKARLGVFICHDCSPGEESKFLLLDPRGDPSDAVRSVGFVYK